MQQGQRPDRPWPGLYVRDGEQIVSASEADVALAQSYPRWASKGPIIDGARLTILIARTRYVHSEDIHVLHVGEILSPGREVYVMGPKPVYGEYRDGLANSLEEEDPFHPTTYNGAVITSPAVDFNYEITVYHELAPGEHELIWKPNAKYQSNVLRFTVAA
jgi:hypothetical protein